MAASDIGTGGSSVQSVSSTLEHDFGAVLARGQTLHHEFVLRNSIQVPIHLLGARAYTPCCSTIGPLPQIIPGDGEVRIPVTWKMDRGTGRKRVQFAIRTDSPQQQFRMLHLTALCMAEWEINEPSQPSSRRPVGRPGNLTLRVICRRRGDEGRAAPRTVVASEPLSARFVGMPVETSRGGDVIESARDVEVALPVATEPGRKRGELVFRWADGSAERHQLDWEVVPRVRAIPAGLVIEPSDDATRSVLITSDDRPFRIIDVSGPLVPGSFRPPERPLRTHRVRLELDPKKAHGVGASDIRVRIDHPDQRYVTLSVLVMPDRGGLGE